MAVDPYASEPAVQIPPDLWDRYSKAVSAYNGWKAYLESLREEIEAVIGDAHAAKVGDQKVITYRPIDTFSVAGIKRDYPEIAQHFVHEVTREEFDLAAFRKQHAEIAEKYQSRQFRIAA